MSVTDKEHNELCRYLDYHDSFRDSLSYNNYYAIEQPFNTYFEDDNVDILELNKKFEEQWQENIKPILQEAIEEELFCMDDFAPHPIIYKERNFYILEYVPYIDFNYDTIDVCIFNRYVTVPTDSKEGRAYVKLIAQIVKTFDTIVPIFKPNE